MKPKYPCLKPIPVKCACGCGVTVHRDKYKLKRFPKSYVRGHQFKGPLNVNWKGGRKKGSHGHIMLLMPDHPNATKSGYVNESHYVMSQFLNRPIDTQKEVVHHINGDVADNRLENLMIATRPSHASHHHKGLIKPNSLKNLQPRQKKSK